MVYQLTSSQTVAHSSPLSSPSVYSNSAKSRETSSSCSIPNQMGKLSESTRSSNNTYVSSVIISKTISTIYSSSPNSPTTTSSTTLHKSPPFTPTMNSTRECSSLTPLPRRTPTLQ